MLIPQKKLISHNRFQRKYYEYRSAKQNRRITPNTRGNQSSYISNHLDRLIKFGQLRQTHRILDIGAGMGKYTIPLAKMGYNLEALDLSPKLLQQLNTYCGNNVWIQTHCMDFLNPHDSFTQQYDMLIGAFVLHHLINIGVAFDKMALLLRPGGKIAFLDVNPYCPLYYLQVFLSPSMHWRAEKGLVRLTPKTVTSKLKAAGFEDIKITKFGIAPPIIRNCHGGHVVDEAFDAIPFLNAFSAFQVICARLSQ